MPFANRRILLNFLIKGTSFMFVGTLTFYSKSLTLKLSWYIYFTYQLSAEKHQKAQYNKVCLCMHIRTHITHVICTLQYNRHKYTVYNKST